MKATSRNNLPPGVRILFISRTAWWGLITEYDLAKIDKVPAKLDKFVTMLRVKYGYTSEQAKKEIGKHVSEYEAEQNSAVKPA